MNKKAYLVIILLLGVLIRAGYLVAPHIDSDQAIFALQGIHILKGEFPVFQWGLAYMGDIQSYFDAFLFYLFGPSRLVVDIVPVIISLFFIVITYLLGKEIFGEKGGILSALFASVAPFYLSIHGGWARYGYMETLLFGSFILLITLRLSKAEDRKDRGRLLILLGFVSGIGFWTNFLIITYFPAVGLYLLIKDRRIFKKETFLAIPSFILGSLPVWIYNLRHSFASLGILEVGHKEPFIKNLKGLILVGMPEIIGVKTPDGTMIYGISYIILAIYLLSFIYLIIKGIKDFIPAPSALSPKGRGQRVRGGGTGLILLFFLSFFLIFSASGFGSSVWGTRRYLLPLYSVAPVILCLLLIRIKEHSKPLMTGIALFILSINSYGNIKDYAFIDQKGFKEYKERRRIEREIFNFMKGKEVVHSYVLDYWLGPRLTFDSGEEIIFAQPLGDRNPDYTRRINEAKNFSYLIGINMAVDFEESLKRIMAGYEKKVFGEYLLFYSIKPPSMGFKEIPRDGWSASASEEMRYIKDAYDRDMTTRAVSRNAQMPGMYYEIDMGRPYRVNKISLIPGLPNDSPRGCRIELSIDGSKWKNVATIRNPLDLYWEKDRSEIDGSGRLVAIFEAIPARFVKLTLTENDPVYSLSMAEIFLYEETEAKVKVENPNFIKGLLYEKEGKLAEAIKEYKKALRIETMEDIYNRIGLIYYELKILVSYPYERGITFEKAGLWEEAIEEYKKIIGELGNNSIGSIYIHLRNCYKKVGDKGKVKEINETLLKEFIPANPARINYGGKIIFFGYDLNRNRVKRGESLNIIYYWEGVKLMDKDYIIFVHFKSDDYLFQHDHRPLEGMYYRGTYKTNEWPEGEKVRESHEISVPEDIKPGIYKINIGIFDSKTGKRLKVEDGKKRDEMEIGQIEVL